MRAVIYRRVSTKEQTKNLSLASQQKTCRQFCKQQGWTVDRVFVERGESAKTADRTELTRLLTYCRENDGRVQVLLVYALDRFARNGYDHHVVRAHLAKIGITLRSATQPIDESPTGKLMEGVLASFAQFDNDQRAQRTVLGMKEALRRGQWVFPAPVGYRNVRRLDGTKTIEPDPQVAPLVRRAFELYASGLYSQKEVLAQVSAEGLRTKRGLEMSKQSFGKMLRHPLYGGRLRNDEWGIDVRGDFVPVVDEHTFHRAQVVLADSKLAGKKHTRNNPDFPLRRFVRCAHCGSSLARLEGQKKRLVDVYVYEQAIDQAAYRRELLKLNQEIALAKVEEHDNELDGLDVETVLEFAEHVVVNARRIWSEFNLKQRRKLQKVLFPEGLAWEGEEFRTPVTCLFFRDLEASEPEIERMVARTGFEPVLPA